MPVIDIHGTVIEKAIPQEPCLKKCTNHPYERLSHREEDPQNV